MELGSPLVALLAMPAALLLYFARSASARSLIQQEGGVTWLAIYHLCNRHCTSAELHHIASQVNRLILSSPELAPGDEASKLDLEGCSRKVLGDREPPKHVAATLHKCLSLVQDMRNLRVELARQKTLYDATVRSCAPGGEGWGVRVCS